MQQFANWPPVCRYGVEETCQLLQDVGIRNTSQFEANGITGADLLDLEEDDLRSELGLTKLQARACAGVTALWI